jgi:LuxR family maltose regulon positive regulatory protein
MPSKPPTLAKLTRPRLHGAVPRERLFSRLDEARSRSAICVVGPPGAGKTTLVASWLDARGIPGIWYQVDPGDEDIATFFYYLGRAAAPFSELSSWTLPVLTPEYLHDVFSFARRFFRELFARLPSSATLVLDNYQEVAPGSVFHQVVVEAVSEVPAGSTLIAISRADPPSNYARLIANENVELIEWSDLRLTLDETRAIVEARTGLTESDLRLLHEGSGGWAAGLTLLLERRKKGEPLGELATGAALDTVFDYFAGQIFDQLAPDMQRFLACVGFLPRIAPSLAYQLTGEARAAEILEDLHRRHLFTDRRVGAETVYQFHALFQAFLRSRAARLLSVGEQQELVARSARLLETRGLTDDAFTLYREAQEWEAATQLILKQARRLLAQGRGQTLRDWIAAVPSVRGEHGAWLSYWLGASLVEVDQAQSRSQLERAFAGFEISGDLVGQTLAACGVIDSYYFEWSDFRPMARWIAALEKLLSRAPVLDSQETELHVYSSLLIAMLYGQPGHPMLSLCVQRVMEMLDLDLEVNHRVTAATFLVSYCALTCDLERGKQVMAKIQPLLRHPDVSPLNQLWWRTRMGYLLWNMTDYDGSMRVLRESQDIANAHGLAGLRSAAVLTLNYQMLVAIATGDHRTAEAMVRQLESTTIPTRPMGAWHQCWSRIQAALGQDNQRPAFEVGAQVVAAAFETGMVYVQILSLIAEANGFAEFGPHEKVVENLERARALASGTCFAYLESECLLSEAYSLLCREDLDRGLPLLRQALEHARRSGYAFHLRWCASLLTRVCAEALAAGIELDYVRGLVRKYRVRPPSPEIEHWPWPLRIYALGRFQVLLDEAPLRFEGKTPRKPLLLLKAIVALGGRDVPLGRLADLLWPDEEGDTGHKALGVALVRLRKLLGRHDVLQVTDEQVSLNPNLCWIDVWAFERLAARTEAELTEVQPGRAAQLIDQVLGLYPGNFLPNEADQPWTVTARLRVRGMFTRIIENLGAHLEACGEWEKALGCYRRGLEVDDLIEEFYLGTMRCYQALNRPAEGMAIFRRLRQTLSIVLGVSPSPASEAMVKSLRESGRLESGAP